MAVVAESAFDMGASGSGRTLARAVSAYSVNCGRTRRIWHMVGDRNPSLTAAPAVARRMRACNGLLEVAPGDALVARIGATIAGHVRGYLRRIEPLLNEIEGPPLNRECTTEEGVTARILNRRTAGCAV